MSLLAYSAQRKSKSLTFSTLLYQSIRIALNRTYQAETKQTRTFSCQLLRRIVYFAPKAFEWDVFYRENCPALILDLLDGFMFALLCAILMNPNWQLLIQNSVSNESKQGKALVIGFPNPLALGSDIPIHGLMRQIHCTIFVSFLVFVSMSFVCFFLCLLCFVFVYCKAGPSCEEDWSDKHIAQKHRRNSLFMPSVKIIWGWSKLSEFSTGLTNGFTNPTQNRGTVVQQIGYKLRSLQKEKQICHFFLSTQMVLKFRGNFEFFLQDFWFP